MGPPWFSQSTWSRFLTAVLIVACCVACQNNVPAGDMRVEGAVYSFVPELIDPSARYLIYLHGAIIESAGERPTHAEFGVYEYRKILETFAAHGFVVISETRQSGTDGFIYAEKVAAAIRGLLEAGVPPQHVTVAGFSKGGGIAIAASWMLAEDDVNFVFMAACNPWLDSRPEIVARGRLLSLREASDLNFGTCENLFERSPSPHDHRELVLEIGGGHGAFYRPQSEWIDPVLRWALEPG